MATIGSFAFDIAEILQKPEAELAECVAETMIEDGVTTTKISCFGNYEVTREMMPAVQRMHELRLQISAQDANSSQLTWEAPSTRSFEKSVSERASSNRENPSEIPNASNFMNIPASPQDVRVPGYFTESRGGVVFVQPDRSVAHLEDDAKVDELPMDVPVLARLTTVRGPRGGWADRRVRVLEWVVLEGDDVDGDTRGGRMSTGQNTDEEEFDLLPGTRSEDLRTISDPGHDLYDERALIEQQTLAGFVGRLESDGDDVLLITDDGDEFLLDGDVDVSGRLGQGGTVVVGRAGLESDDKGRRRLIVDDTYPTYS